MPTATAGRSASGFSTASAATAARQFLKANQTLYGLGPAQWDALDVLLERRIGQGSVVLLRQRLGGLPVGDDGLSPSRSSTAASCTRRPPTRQHVGARLRHAVRRPGDLTADRLRLRGTNKQVV